MSVFNRYHLKNYYPDLQRLIKEDQQILDELIEEGFGDFIRKVGSGIKGGAQKIASKIKETLSAGIATSLVKAIVSAIPKEQLDNFAGHLITGKVPQQTTNEVQRVVTESLYKDFKEDKYFLANLLFTESNILAALQNANILLTEMQSVGIPTAGKASASSDTRPSRELQKYAKEVAQKIQSLYKNKNAMATAIPKFADSVSKYLGVTPRTSSSMTGATTTPSNPTTGGAFSSPDVADPAAGSSAVPNATSGSTTAGPSSGSGLISKIMKSIKTYPKISAATGAALLGIVVAAFAGSAPVVAPVIVASLKAAGWTAAGSVALQKLKGVGGALLDGGVEAAKQQFKDNKVDLKTTAKHAGTAALTVGLGKLFAVGLGVIAGTFAGLKLANPGSDEGTNQQENSQGSQGSESQTSRFQGNQITPADIDRVAMNPKVQEILSQKGIDFTRDPDQTWIDDKGFKHYKWMGVNTQGYKTGVEVTDGGGKLKVYSGHSRAVGQVAGNPTEPLNINRSSMFGKK